MICFRDTSGREEKRVFVCAVRGYACPGVCEMVIPNHRPSSITFAPYLPTCPYCYPLRAYYPPYSCPHFLLSSPPQTLIVTHLLS